MPKVVVNSCYGGFNLSPAAMFRYGELIGRKLYLRGDGYWDIPNPPDQPTWEDREAYKAFNDLYVKHTVSAYDMPRDDPKLIQAIMDVGIDKAGGPHSSLRIVDIPNGIEWHIDEYDGLETVRESHRTW